MDSETPPVVNLEITVPHIVLSLLKNRVERMVSTERGQNAASKNIDVREQVWLLPLGFDQSSVSAKDISERMTHSVKFHLFRLNIPWIGKPIAFQVFRRWKADSDQNQSEAGRIKGEHQGMYATETSAFSLEFHQQDKDARPHRADAFGAAQQGFLQAGLHRVVIYLDKEGIPSSYSIDGAES